MITRVAAYRMQLRYRMGFAVAARLVPYLAALGVNHLHLSPPFRVCVGSTQGYDVVDLNSLDLALGGGSALLAPSDTLHAASIGLILDIVANLMGMGADNGWWWDVLAMGRTGLHADVVDIDFGACSEGKVVLPVLGRPAHGAIAAGELRIEQDGPALAFRDPAGLATLRDRLAVWQRKSLREAKLRSSWVEPDEDHESGARDFPAAVLDPGRSSAILQDLARLIDRIDPAGAANGLAQTLMKLTEPGVPDLYQGAELWDDCLIDPGNRRPVGWADRKRLLGSSDDLDAMVGDRKSGARIHAFAFARQSGDAVAITIAGRGWLANGLPRTLRDAWSDSAMLMPEGLAGRSHRATGAGSIPLAAAFDRLPAALLG